MRSRNANGCRRKPSPHSMILQALASQEPQRSLSIDSDSNHPPRAMQTCRTPAQCQSETASDAPARLIGNASVRSWQVPPQYQRLSAADVRFTVWHRFRAPGTECAAGEEVAAVSFVTNQREYFLPLSLTLRLVFDFLARHRHVPLGAAQIAASFRADPFYRKHGSNALNSGALIRRVSISSVRVYIERIRRAMTLSFREANLRIDPQDVLQSRETVTNAVGYIIRSSVEWVHSDHPGPEFAWVK
jgi:hypothetical protein